MWYCDASAVFKLAIHEPESSALETAIQGKDLVTSQLSITEVGRAILRREPTATHALDQTIGRFDLIPLSPTVLIRAAEIPPTLLRALDAIHIASALQLGRDCDGVITYDIRMQKAARDAGFTVLSPGAGFELKLADDGE